MNYWFSVNLKRYREERGLSQRQLAKMINTSQPIISAWENNMKYPLIDKAYDVAKALDISISQLLDCPEEATY